ncbi:MAG: response regulator [Lentisphaeria bacterium]|nr:response regulator [Lentisphaeria bacterium]NQZ66625.1 response regulator [Lentisphaeria bacterium]
MKILLIDDSIAYRLAQIKVFSSLGITDIDEANDGKEGIAMLKKNGFSYNLIMLDINMPVMSGRETLKIIRKINKTIPVIMCTSEAEKHLILECISHGANNYLVKPVNKDDLTNKVLPIIEKSKTG